ncbi:MAG: hypothetical protein ACD_28C00035G0017 [uncultured bacterium]|nr:MAG: hypothetical protein ACD_28C00035G0017 [uncultured bacterium]KKT72886.1 MAG: ATP synthase epsilon chain [Candidatus Peregrinibacteria bacterium GW2011_GWA2_44_7]
MTNAFKLTIRTPEGEVYHKEAKSIAFNDEDGQNQIFAHHASLTSTILFSHVIVEEEEMEEKFLARNGLFLFNNQENTGLLLALYCEKKSEISHQTAAQYLKFLEKQLAEGNDLSEFQVLYLEGEKLAVEKQVSETEEAPK